MPIIRKILKVGDSKAITLPKSWIAFLERENQEITEVTIEVDKVLTVSPILLKKKLKRGRQSHE
jgi:antitoxin component of MazEF toxin-antitoxin module